MLSGDRSVKVDFNLGAACGELRPEDGAKVLYLYF